MPSVELSLSPTKSMNVVSDADDAKEILQGRAYHWHDWSICRGRDCLYVWSDSAALELSNGSNGWFRFILDGKLATMYSSGSPENGNDNSGMSLKFNFLYILYSFFARAFSDFLKTDDISEKVKQSRFYSLNFTIPFNSFVHTHKQMRSFLVYTFDLCYFIK